MDWIVPVAIAANTLVLLGGIVVGGRLLLPTAQQLAAHVDRLLAEKQASAKLTTQLEALTNELAATREELARVSEQREFLESLVEKQPPKVLPPA